MNIEKTTDSIWENKTEKGFSTTNVEQEFNLLHGEISEAYNSYYKNDKKTGEELADSFIYLLSLARMLDVNIEEEVKRKIDINKKRIYTLIDNVLTKNA